MILAGKRLPVSWLALPSCSWGLSQEVMASDLGHCLQLFLPGHLFAAVLLEFECSSDFVSFSPAQGRKTHPAFLTGQGLGGLEFFLEWKIGRGSFC